MSYLIKITKTAIDEAELERYRKTIIQWQTKKDFATAEAFMGYMSGIRDLSIDLKKQLDDERFE